jgi:FkbH-like protein
MQVEASAATAVNNRRSNQTTTLRREVDQLISEHAVRAAADRLARLWRMDPGPATAAFVVSRYERLSESIRLVQHRLAILRSFTVEPVVPLLRAAAFVAGIDLTVHVGNFNTYAQEMIDPRSSLHAFRPDTVLLAVQTRDIAPDLWDHYASMASAEVQASAARIINSFRGWLEAFRSQSSANLVVHSLETPSMPRLGILDHQVLQGQTATIQQLNRELRGLGAAHAGVHILDYDALIGRHGRDRWHDERKWLTMRLPLTTEAIAALTMEWMRFLHPLVGRVCKVLVTDLDNTLWGGVIGEGGIGGIKLCREYPGAAYRALQQVILDLHARGIILAVSSKNNEADAHEAMSTHPEMLLRPAHFAALRINWNDKVQSLKEISGELNVGLDALAFLDDNPVERERVRTVLPEVTVIDLPDEPMEYAGALQASPVFERLSLSAEDRERGRYYAEQRQRTELMSQVASMEEFFRSLEQVVTVMPAKRETSARVAQLTQKTNQFNLTTRRYSEQQIRELSTSPSWDVLCIYVRDRFGDNGMVGVVLTRDHGKVCEIDSFLLSCRVIGRTVETAVLSFLVERARKRGCHALHGSFVPTKKNAPARQFFAVHGFRRFEEGEGSSRWALDIGQTSSTCPDWITLTTQELVCV